MLRGLNMVPKKYPCPFVITRKVADHGNYLSHSHHNHSASAKCLDALEMLNLSATMNNFCLMIFTVFTLLYNLTRVQAVAAGAMQLLTVTAKRS